MDCLRPLLIIGTRPEAIKMAPVVRQCRQRGKYFQPIVCFTGQHREMLWQVAWYFGIQPDLDLDLMQPGQALSGLTARCLEGLDGAITRYQPDCVVAQGDTTTAMAASIAAFYRRVPLVHVEAGLRTGDVQSPWPEEFNRRIAALVAGLHCAPTRRAAQNVLAEGADARTVHVTGNTVIDALLWTVQRERERSDQWSRKFDFPPDRRVVLVTCHRRENFGRRFGAICRALRTLAERFPTALFVYPVHLNPQVHDVAFRRLADQSNILLIPPVSYPEFVWLMDRSTLILTDSGGVQEEAPSLGKPVLVLRDTTERPEALEAGAAQLVGTCEQAIVQSATTLLEDPAAYAEHQPQQNPYGDGQAARRIVDLMLSRAWWCRRPRGAAA